tara:strand:- start:801 stop:929 length:129 start_codon:yes stop_codon:yes gene_type:complete
MRGQFLNNERERDDDKPIYRRYLDILKYNKKDKKDMLYLCII